MLTNTRTHKTKETEGEEADEEDVMHVEPLF